MHKKAIAAKRSNQEKAASDKTERREWIANQGAQGGKGGKGKGKGQGKGRA
jgi:hypothetical protein